MLKQVQHDIIDLIAIWATRPEDLTRVKYWLNLVNIFYGTLNKKISYWGTI
jgi:hypothetical protein